MEGSKIGLMKSIKCTLDADKNVGIVQVSVVMYWRRLMSFGKEVN